MKDIFTKIFVQNWQRKLLSIVLAIVIWLMIHHSISVAKIEVP